MISHEYVEHESGRKGADKRRQFAALFDDAAKRKFDCVLFWALDRFSREGMAQTIAHLQCLVSYGVAFLKQLMPFDVKPHYTDSHRLPEDVENELKRIPLILKHSHCMPEIVGTFLRTELWDEGADGAVKAWDGSHCHFTQESLEFAVGQVDGIEVRANISAGNAVSRPLFR